MFSTLQEQCQLLQCLPQVAMMVNFGFPISAMDLPQLVPPMFREEWRCALMEHLGHEPDKKIFQLRECAEVGFVA